MSSNRYAFNIKSIDSQSSPDEYGDVVTIDLSDVILSDRPLYSIRIISVVWPNLAFNVIDRGGYSNNSMTITIGGNPYSITVPAGFYDGNALLTTIATLFNAVLSPNYSIFTNWNTNTALTDIRVEDSVGSPVVFDMSCTTTTGGTAYPPSLLELLGFAYSSYTGATSYTSEGPLNTVMDRIIGITCDEVNGLNTTIDSLGSEPWIEGLVAYMPYSGAFGDIVPFKPNYAMNIRITASGDNRVFHFRLVRERYPFFGPSMINWTMLLEIS